MLRLFSRYAYTSLRSAAKKNNQFRPVKSALTSTSTKKSATASIFIKQYIRNYGTSNEPTAQNKHQKVAKITSEVQTQESTETSTTEMLKYHTFSRLIRGIDNNPLAVRLGEVAMDPDCEEDKDEDIEDEDEEDEMRRHQTKIQVAIKKAYKSVSFAYDLGDGLRGLYLHVREGDGNLYFCGTVGYSLSSEKLKEYSVPAPYGDLKTTTTKVDPEVRSAWIIDYEKIVIKRNSDFNEKNRKEDTTKQSAGDDPHYIKALQDLLSRVQEEFQDDTLYLEPYKLNVYEKGGFFKPHVDTPRYENMVGTLVVRLDADNCQGGDLIICHGDETFTAHGGATAFFCDREHEVTLVIEGVRISLTFSICKDSPSVAKSDQAITLTRTAPLVKDHNIAGLIKAIKESPFKKVGLLTEFDYTQKGISLQSLKGSDRVVFEELSKEPSFKIDLLPTVVSTSYCENDHNEGNVYRFLTEDMERMLRGEEAPKMSAEDQNIKFFQVKDGLEVYYHEQEGAERTGNEALEHTIDNIYFNGAIVVTDLTPKSKPKKEKLDEEDDEDS